MNKIVGLVWFFGFWAMSLWEQQVFGKFEVSNFFAGFMFISLWFVPTFYFLFNKE